MSDPTATKCEHCSESERLMSKRRPTITTSNLATTELLRLEQVCALLQISRPKIETLPRNKELRVLRLGHRSVRISRCRAQAVVRRRQAQETP
jgi:excisionase family DNA binding protein